MDASDLQILVNATCYCPNGTDALKNTTWRSADGSPGVLDLGWYLNTAAQLPLSINGTTTTLVGCGGMLPGAFGSSAHPLLLTPLPLQLLQRQGSL
jgi:hypothetical protein